MKNEKGITLVALIITIIVMLILVAVTVSIVINSDLIGTAENAAGMYENADDGLENISTNNIIQNATYGTINEYLTDAQDSVNGN